MFTSQELEFCIIVHRIDIVCLFPQHVYLWIHLGTNAKWGVSCPCPKSLAVCFGILNAQSLQAYFLIFSCFTVNIIETLLQILNLDFYPSSLDLRWIFLRWGFVCLFCLFFLTSNLLKRRNSIYMTLVYVQHTMSSPRSFSSFSSGFCSAPLP